MDQGFSNYLFGNRQSLAISEVQSHHHSINIQSQLNYDSQHITPNELDSEFHDLYNYSTNVLKTWGITLGLLTPSKQNMKTVNALMQLIRMRHKDLDFKAKMKQDAAKSQYQKETMKTKIKLAQNETSDYKKRLGQFQNKYKQQEMRFRKEVKQLNAEKQELIQVRQKLEQKNTQICHQMKKREAEINRVKDSMKKGGDKVMPKNSFDLVSAVVQEREGEEQGRFGLMKEKYENERKYYVRENSILKEQLGDAEEIINNFIVFVKQNCQLKALQQLHLYPNHPMNYNEGRLLERLHQTLEILKTSILTIIQQPIKPRSTPTPQPVSSKSFKRANTFQTAPKLSQSIQIKPSTTREPEDYYFKNDMKDDISIISHIEVKDIEMPMKGKEDYDKWDILYDGRF